MNLLVVDDEYTILQGIVSMIKDFRLEGLEKIFFADSPDRAMEIAMREKIHVLVTDINMKPIDGLTLIDQLRQSHPKMSAVIISGYAEFHYAKEAMRLSVADYILKPVDEDELKNALKNALAKCDTDEDDLTESSIVNCAVSFIKENLTHDLTLAVVADSVGVSYSYLSRVFASAMGKTFREYVNGCRAEYAAKLLRESPAVKVYEIAELLHYSNVRSFSGAFKKHFGILPVEYRTRGEKPKN